MGNAAVSCAPLIIFPSSPGGAAKVLTLDGRMEVFTRQVKAAELMVENPGQFLCESTTLKVGNRIHGLTADKPLERRRLYFLLPMDLLYSVLTHEELSSLAYKASKALKNSRGFKNFSRIFPVFGDFRFFNVSESKRLDCDDYVIISVTSSHNPEPVILLERYSKQRSWKPALETIDETPCTY
ncbi:hypothetical protein EV1_015762 [Malus domestica]|uniref:uncharacterized protein LOC126600599 n=1 Tax=Malus sylvestris TaxID=3752 RepID=UPI0021ACB892|nr:uncharacterized protein LOC126600599 [Malus sylvestris]